MPSRGRESCACCSTWAAPDESRAIRSGVFFFLATAISCTARKNKPAAVLVVQVSRERALSVFASSSTLTWSETVSCLLAIGRCGTHNSIDNPSQFHPSNVRHHPFTVVSKWVRTGDTYKHRLLNDNPVPVLYLSVRVTWTLLTLNPRKVIGLRRLLNKYLEEKNKEKERAPWPSPTCITKR